MLGARTRASLWPTAVSIRSFLWNSLPNVPAVRAVGPNTLTPSTCPVSSYSRVYRLSSEAPIWAGIAHWRPRHASNWC